MKHNISGFPEIVSPEDWHIAREAFLKKEKAFTRQQDGLNAERRRLPMAEIKKDYAFEGPEGKVSLLDLFEGRQQPLLYHFMFAPTVHGWPVAGCPGCSMFVDNIGNITHLHARDTSFVLVSRAPLANIENYKKRMDWYIPWYSSAESAFNMDFGVTTDKGETFGLSVFIHDGGRVFRTYFTSLRGGEALGSIWTFLDLMPIGRQEKWEDTPEGRPQSEPHTWWRRHDEYKPR
ncbi:MAG: DUF899 domain-containing protein [Bacteroidota bacterium]|nr:DUF899 domain-containing protein [Bacteroidota bacterium]